MIIKKKEGRINNLVYEYTVYNNGANTVNISLGSFREIVGEIILTNSTTKNLHITPFYSNEYKPPNIEFDSFDFYIECKENVTKEESDNFHLECNYEGRDMSVDLRKTSFLIQNNDIEGYHNALNTYLSYLDELLPKMVDELFNYYDFKETDFPNGFFCFEFLSD